MHPDRPVSKPCCHVPHWILVLALVCAWAPSAWAQKRPPEQTETDDEAQAETPSEQTPVGQTGTSTDDAETDSDAVAASDAPDAQAPLSQLRDAFAALMDDMVRARNRIAVVGEALFRSRLELWVQNRADDQRLTRLRLFLDDAPVYDGDGQELVQGEAIRLFDGFAAPGRHVLRVQAHQQSPESPEFQYVSDQRFHFQVRGEHVTEVSVALEDDSDMAEDFPEDAEGEYDVRTRVHVEATPLEDR